MVAEVAPVLDNRELSIVLWILVALLWVLARRETRSSLVGVVRAASNPKIAVPLLVMLLYVGGVVTALWSVDVWTWDLLSETLFWLVGTGLVLFLSYDRASSDPRFFRRTALRVLSATVVLEFVVGLYTLSLIAELVLVPILVMLGALLAVSSTRGDLAPVRSCLERAVTIAGLSLLAYSVAKAVADPASFATLDNARELIIPVTLTVCFLPFVYAIAVYGNYDSLLTQLQLLLDDDIDLYRYGRRRLVRTCGVHLRAVLRAARAPWRLMLSRPSSHAEIDRVVAHIKARTPNVLAMSASDETRLRRIATEQTPGWEYQLFAARLDAGATALAHGHQSLDETGRAFETPHSPRKAIRVLQDDNRAAVTLVGDLERTFDQDEAIRAFGAPGEPGDAQRITDLAKALTIDHDRMLQWSQRAHATRTTDELATLVETHAQLLDQPNRQVDDYVDRWNELADQLPQLLKAAEQASDPLRLDMSLIITIDADVLERFEAEAARLGRAA